VKSNRKRFIEDRNTNVAFMSAAAYLGVDVVTLFDGLALFGEDLVGWHCED